MTFWEHLKAVFSPSYPPCPHKYPYATVRVKRNGPESDTAQVIMLVYGDEMTITYGEDVYEDIVIAHRYPEDKGPPDRDEDQPT
jgi:hypothetical protein